MEGAKKTSRRSPKLSFKKKKLSVEEENKPNSGRDSPTSSLAAHPGGRSSSFFNNESNDDDDSSGGEFEAEKKRKTTREDNQKKMEPAQVAKTFERQWVKIGDVEYDVTDMKHPGGVGDLLHVVQRRRGRDGGVSRVSLSIAKSGEDVEVFAAEEVRREESLLL